MLFSPKELQSGFTFGHILSSVKKKQVVKVVIDPWHSGKTGGLCKQIVSGMSKATGGLLDSMFLKKNPGYNVIHFDESITNG